MDYILVNTKYLSCSRDAEANDMIHMGSDHRSVMAQFVITAPKKEESQKAHIKPNKTSTGESIKSQVDERLRYDEASTFEERYFELGKGIKQKAEAAVAAQKPNGRETATEMKQAERGASAKDAAATEQAEGEAEAEANATAAGAEAYAAAAHSPDEDKTAAAKERAEGEAEANATAADAEAYAAAAHNPDEDKTVVAKEQAEGVSEASAAAAKEKIKNTGDALKSQSSTSEKIEDGDDDIRTLIEERRNIKKVNKQQLKKASKKIEKCMRDKKDQKDKKRFSGSWKNSKASRTYRA